MVLFIKPTRISVQNLRTAMKWDNLKTEYYQLLVDSMEKPFIIKAWINIPTISLLTLNPLAPVYVEDYNAYFYINKLEQWRLEYKRQS